MEVVTTYGAMHRSKKCIIVTTSKKNAAKGTEVTETKSIVSLPSKLRFMHILFLTCTGAELFLEQRSLCLGINTSSAAAPPGLQCHLETF